MNSGYQVLLVFFFYLFCKRTFRDPFLDVFPATQLKETQSTDVNQWYGLVLSSYITGLLTEGECFLYAGSPSASVIMVWYGMVW